MARWLAFEEVILDTLVADHRLGAERQAGAMWGPKVVRVRAISLPYTISGRYDVLAERMLGELEASDLDQATRAARSVWGPRVVRVQSLVSAEVARDEPHMRLGPPPRDED